MSSGEECEAVDAGNAQWADSVQKILKAGKSTSKKSIVLSRAKKLTDRKPTIGGQTTDFEIVRGDGECTAVIKPDPVLKTRKKSRPKVLPSGIRRRPTVLDQNHDRMCRKLAEKGVVELFNRVAAAQRKIREQREARRKGCGGGGSDGQASGERHDYGKQLFSEMLLSATANEPGAASGKTKSKKAKDQEEIRNWQEERI